MTVTALNKQFEVALEEVKKLAKRPDNKHMLALYANFKQATTGDCSGKRPGMLDIAGRAKFDSWKKIAGTDPEDAKQVYVDLVSKLQQG